MQEIIETTCREAPSSKHVPAKYVPTIDSGMKKNKWYTLIMAYTALFVFVVIGLTVRVGQIIVALFKATMDGGKALGYKQYPWSKRLTMALGGFSLTWRMQRKIRKQQDAENIRAWERA